jgi:basic membrane lipoprotein Med (substrate-binding protein (PBP1-ABC) superfamily)
MPEHFSAAGYNVARMTFSSFNDEMKKIPPERIPLVLAALAEGTVDNDPAKWQVFGNLRCEMQSGDVIDIELFTVNDSELAFRTDERHYFRGLSAARFAAAIGE